MRAHRRHDPACHGFGIGIRVDHPEPVVARRKAKEPRACAFLKRQPHILEPKLLAGARHGPRQTLGGIKVEQKRQVRLDPNHQDVQLVDRRRQITPRQALKHPR